jgi:hypothetical protein
MFSKVIILSFTVFLLASCQSPPKEEPVKLQKIEIAPIHIKMDVDVKIHGEKDNQIEKGK